MIKALIITAAAIIIFAYIAIYALCVMASREDRLIEEYEAEVRRKLND